MPQLLAPGGEAWVAYPWSDQGPALRERLAGGLRVVGEEVLATSPATVRLLRLGAGGTPVRP
jgi:hypothetical protein